LRWNTTFTERGYSHTLELRKKFNMVEIVRVEVVGGERPHLGKEA
jgi:hypothetical protein